MALQDDIIYVLLLICSILFGKVIVKIRRGNGFRQADDLLKYLSSTAGFIVVLLVSGRHIIHPIFSVILQICLLRFVPSNRVHWVSFFAGFAHLFHFRLCWNFPIIPSLGCPPSHTNAIQMIMTLKMMGLAFEVHDSIGRKKTLAKEDDKSSNLQLESDLRSIENPSAKDIFHYAFCHAGILTGPYYSFRTWTDMYGQRWSRWANCDKALVERGYILPVYVILFILSGRFFPLDIVKDDTFYEESSILWRIFYMTPVFFNFRMRLYSGFVLSECTCISAGLGVYPEASEPKPGMGPTKLEVLKEWVDKSQDDDNEPIGEAKALGLNFETIHNIDEYATETVSTMREALKTWNMTVQYWLASNVYRRLPGVSRGLRSVAVMIVSSAWHGVYSGYYLSLGSVPFVLVVEDLYERLLRKRLLKSTTNEGNNSSTPKSVKLYDIVAWFSRFQWFSYLGMGFQLLSIELTMKFWHSIYYIGHLGLPIFYIIGISIFKPIVNKFLPPTISSHQHQS